MFRALAPAAPTARLPSILPFLPSRLARPLHTTPPRAVRRPQKPFDAHVPLDPAARRAGPVGRRRAAELDTMYALAERRPAANLGGSYGLRVPDDAPENAGPAPPEGELAALRARAMRSSDAGRVREHWRMGLTADDPALSAKKGAERARREERNASRRADAALRREGVRDARRPVVRAKLDSLAAQRGEVGRMRALGFAEGRARWLTKNRWDAGVGAAVLVAPDVRWLPGAGVQGMRERAAVWAAEKRAGRATGPDPTPAELRAMGREGEDRAMEGAETEVEGAEKRRWAPTKRLTYAAMGGLRELHAQDPETWTARALAHKFGISFEAVKRILRSTWGASAEGAAGAKDAGKWSRAADGVNSPVPNIRAVYELKRADEAAAGTEGKGEEAGKEVGEEVGKEAGKGGKGGNGDGGSTGNGSKGKRGKGHNRGGGWEPRR